MILEIIFMTIQEKRGGKMRFKSKIILLIMLIPISVFIFGCGPAILKLEYKPLPDPDNLLASVAPVKIKLLNFEDKRDGDVDSEFIGRVRTRVNAPRKEVKSKGPVSEIIREAVKSELTRNGHSVVENNEDIVMKGEIKAFWIKTAVTSEEWDVSGKIEISIEVVNSVTAHSTFVGPYTATDREKRFIEPGDTVLKRILETSLSQLMQKMSSDTNLANALRKK
jgi:uncharacterized lipoprotein YajG